jgi:hypothetical protein|tara:strand:- start:3987 stop:4196 length:210 start_codon:yes stop_codon:yes gene_type:complete
MEIKLTESDLKVMPTYLAEGLIMWAQGYHPKLAVQHDMTTMIEIVECWTRGNPPTKKSADILKLARKKK